jgi:hypothetical protein
VKSNLEYNLLEPITHLLSKHYVCPALWQVQKFINVNWIMAHSANSDPIKDVIETWAESNREEDAICSSQPNDSDVSLSGF